MSTYHKQNILDANYQNPKKARSLKMADRSDERYTYPANKANEIKEINEKYNYKNT